MPIQRSRFRNVTNTAGRPRDERIVSVGPYAGIDKLSPPTAMSNRYSPDALNMELDGGWLKLRNNWSVVAPFASNAPTDSGKSWAPKGGINFNGWHHLSYRSVNGSTDSLYVAAYKDTDSSFVWLSSKTAYGVFMEAGGTDAYGSVTMTVTPDTQNSGASWTKDTCFIFGQNVLNPGFFMMPASDAGYATSDFSLVPMTGHFSISSVVKYATAANERLVLYGLDTDTRVAHSVRGRPRDFTGEGGGFQDPAVQGEPRGIVTDGDRIVFITTDEVWEGRSRDDAYAFDYRRIAQIGSPHNFTFVSTPFGPTWVGPNQQVYVLRGSEPVAVAKGVANYIRERWGQASIAYLQGAYDYAKGDYVLFWRDRAADREGHSNPGSGINAYFRINLAAALSGQEAWTVHRLAEGVGIGNNTDTHTGFVTTFAYPADADGYLALFFKPSADSNMFSASLADAPSTWPSTYSEGSGRIAGYWTTPVIGRQDLEKETIAALWLDYQSKVTSIASILLTDDGYSYTTVGSITLAPTTYSTDVQRPLSQYSTAYAPLQTRAYRTPQLRLVVAGDSPNTRIGPMRIHMKAYTGKF